MAKKVYNSLQVARKYYFLSNRKKTMTKGTTLIKQKLNYTTAIVQHYSYSKFTMYYFVFFFFWILRDSYILPLQVIFELFSNGF